MKTLLISGALLGILGCSASPKVDLKTVNDFNTERYMGKWYEIARFDHRFERGMDSVTANYSFRPDGLIRVENRGFRNGKWNTAVGKAKPAYPAEPGSLRVSFFWVFYAPYRVIMLDTDYRWAMVSSGPDYLWILSRTPRMDASTLHTILSEAQQRGFDTSKLTYPKQPTNPPLATTP